MVGGNSNFSKITFFVVLKELRHEDFAVLRNKYVLKSSVSAFTRTQNAPVKITGRYQMNFNTYLC